MKKRPRSALKLPRYTRRKHLAAGTSAYFFEPPTWAKKQNCPIAAEALGTDYDAAVERAEKVLLPAFDSWRSRGLSDLVPMGGPEIGTFDWLVGLFKGHQFWRDLDRKTQRMYEQGLALFADYRLKDGSRVGDNKLLDLSRAVVDAIYAKLIIVTEKDESGVERTRERRRTANAAMTACRRAWFVGIRADEKNVPASNPFSRMGLKARAPGTKARETPTATWDELLAFRAEAKRQGFQSLATAALIAWEWLQREEHIFGAFEIGHYRPKERPNSALVVHPKTGEEAWWPLYDDGDDDPVPLFPELMAELDLIKSSMVSGLAIRRDHPTRRGADLKPWITPKGDLDYMRATVKRLIRDAGLRDELSFASFRHGGFTEGADADMTDAELRAAGRHRSARQLPTYAKRTRKQLVSGAHKRRATRTKAGNLSE